MKPYLILGLSLGLAGCSGISTSYDYDPSAKFDNLKTWAWHEEDRNGDFDSKPSARPMNQLVARRIRGVVESEMARRGYVQDSTGKPDFWVSPAVAVGQRIDASSFDYGWGPGYDYETYVRVYDEGTLILDVLSGKDRRLIWRGIAQAEVDPGSTPEERTARVREAVTKIMDGFPPKK